MNIIYRPSGAALEYAYYGLNHYTGCNHGCVYCYMKAMDNRYGTIGFDNSRIRGGNRTRLLRSLAADCRKLAGCAERVHLCFSTDPYQRLDQTEQLTREVIKMLRDYTIPFQVLTKGVNADRDFDLYGPDDLFGVTLTVLKENLAIFYEPMSATPSLRKEQLYKAHCRGIKTWVSLEPVLNAQEAFRIIEETAEYVDLYKIGKLNHKKNPGVNWRQFAGDVVNVCNRLKKKYYLKAGLAKYLDPSAYQNTDWRIVG